MLIRVTPSCAFLVAFYFLVGFTNFPQSYQDFTVKFKQFNQGLMRGMFRQIVELTGPLCCDSCCLLIPLQALTKFGFSGSSNWEDGNEHKAKFML